MSAEGKKCGNCEVILLGASFIGRRICRDCRNAQLRSKKRIRISQYRKRPPLYEVWRSMWKRCEKPSMDSYKNYGGRGITVCDEWLSFHRFAEDMGPKPSPLHSIDRINNDGNYEPGNCRWATATQQNWNSRLTNLITHNGETLPVIEWARRVSGDPNYHGGGLRKLIRKKGVAYAMASRLIRNPDGSLGKGINPLTISKLALTLLEASADNETANAAGMQT